MRRFVRKCQFVSMIGYISFSAVSISTVPTRHDAPNYVQDIFNEFAQGYKLKTNPSYVETKHTHIDPIRNIHIDLNTMELKVVQLSEHFGLQPHSIINVTEFKADQDRIFKIDYFNKNINKLESIVMKISENRSVNQLSMCLEVIKKLSNDGIPCPSLIPLSPKYQEIYGNEFICKFVYNNKKYKAFCISHIDGILYADIIDSNRNFYRHLGETIGKISKSLDGYYNKHAEIYDDWDIRYIEEMYENTKEYIPKESIKFKLVDHYMNQFRNVVQLKIPFLRKSVCHSDLHHHNIFCDISNKNQIGGIIDFGDLNLTCTLFELSYACCHFMLNKSKEEGINVMIDMVDAYNKVFPLEDIELDVLFDSICLHALIRVLSRAKDVATYPQNEQHWGYYVIPCWKLLQQYKDIDHDQVRLKIEAMIAQNL